MATFFNGGLGRAIRGATYCLGKVFGRFTWLRVFHGWVRGVVCICRFSFYRFFVALFIYRGLFCTGCPLARLRRTVYWGSLRLRWIWCYHCLQWCHLA